MEMYNNPVKRLEMGNHARKMALENFDIKKNALRILDIYRALVVSEAKVNH